MEPAMSAIIGTLGKDLETLERLCAVVRECQGCVALDAAPRYGNLEVVGEVMRKSGIARESFLVTTKVNASRQREMGARESLASDLAALGLDYVDHYLIHSSSYEGFARTWEEMVRLKEEGLVRSIGVSTFAAGELAALPGEPPAIVQVPPQSEYAGEEMMARLHEAGVRVEGYSFVRKLVETSSARPELEVLCKENGMDLGMAAVSWCWQHGIVPILGTTRPERLASCLSVASTPLDEELETAIGEALFA